MPRNPEDLGGLLDSALDSILSSGWEDPVAEASSQVVIPEYPPLPVREEVVAPAKAKHRAPQAGTVVQHLESQAHGGALKRTETSEGEPDEGSGHLFNVGLLADLASGRKTLAEAATAGGVSEGEIQSQLAVALREVDPKEIAKALGLQAAEQQLKSGAIYGAVIASLVADMAGGRLKPDLKIELAKFLAKVGRIEPKEDKAVAGGGFVLNISMGAAPAQPVTIEAT